MGDENHEHGDAEWGLEADFDIDDGSLEGLTRHQVFVLGVEWGMLFQQIECEPCSTSKLVLVTVHTENAERLVRLCRRKGREPLARDIGEGWTELRFMTNKEALDELRGGGA
ncbi:MAG TPA: hypothetical protein VMZ50_04920 [Phycisphaerae bacterium]|nr:hypothetical protein [Phycisphaerae bacterium]